LTHSHFSTKKVTCSRQIVDGSGILLNQISYDSFGNITNQTNASVTFRFGYTGREFDSETGQYYYRARYYDPKVGRFTSEDGLGFGAGDTNLSRYVFNSPTNFTDPSGMVVWWIPVAVITVISVLAADGIAPNPAQTPTSRCDNDPTDNSGKRALIEAAIGAGPGLIKAAPRIAGAVPGVIRGLPGVADDLGRRLNPSVLDKLRSNPNAGAIFPTRSPLGGLLNDVPPGQGIAPYRPITNGMENHHGILDVWAKNNISGYRARSGNSPTISLTPNQHNATKEVYREWLRNKTGQPVGAKVDWNNVSPREIHDLSESMFDSARVPQALRRQYYSEFNRYIYGQ
jgi:RHS repeat-associated protein